MVVTHCAKCVVTNTRQTHDLGTRLHHRLPALPHQLPGLINCQASSTARPHHKICTTHYHMYMYTVQCFYIGHQLSI